MSASAMARAENSVAVIGGGIIGVCCALYLQQAGFAVTVLDPAEPGSNTSFGAAGNFGGNAHFSIPGILWKIPKMLADPLHPFSLRFRDLPTLLPWFREYMACAEPGRAAAIADAARRLGEGVYERYVALLTEAGEPGLITKRGRLFVWTTDPGFQRDQYGLEYRRKQGIQLDILTGEQVREMEPTIGPIVRHGAYAADAGHILNPFRLVTVLAGLFTRKGGTILREEVRAIRFAADGAPEIDTDRATHRPAQAVLAAGIWSRRIAERLGIHIPLVAERGYHAMLANPGIDMRISTLWEERKVIFTPMEHGLRASGIAEFADPDAKPRWRFADLVARTARELFPG
ncbi:MAG: FAD-binding oxidoreductase, partial [Acidisphaera sp.]|nr:FAD-binding oxidoreductase [Acidisphaera sp.]